MNSGLLETWKRRDNNLLQAQGSVRHFEERYKEEILDPGYNTQVKKEDPLPFHLGMNPDILTTPASWRLIEVSDDPLVVQEGVMFLDIILAKTHFVLQGLILRVVLGPYLSWSLRLRGSVIEDPWISCRHTSGESPSVVRVLTYARAVSNLILQRSLWKALCISVDYRRGHKRMK